VLSISSQPTLAGQAKRVNFPKRVDLHCHSRASTEADEAVLLAIHCPESYSEPRQILAQAHARGMDFATITDHDSISGALEIAHEPNFLIGEELTCWFPEDRCKMHVLVWGIGRIEHEALQTLAPNIYDVADYIAGNKIAHSVAHPLYRQNGVLDRWHIERLLLLFKGFECLNGAHSMIHRQAFEPLLDELDEAMIQRLQRSHGINAKWPLPWIKSRTGGSDDHGLLNIGKTWTEFPTEISTTKQLLDCLREGNCRPGGEAGSSLKLAHNFYGVGIRYYARQLARGKSSGQAAMLERLVGDRPPVGKLATAAGALKLIGGRIVGKAKRTLGFAKPARGTARLAELFTHSVFDRIRGHRPIVEALMEGRAPLAEHEEMFDLVKNITRDIAEGLGDSGRAAAADGQLGEIIDLISPILAQQAILAPYYFALFHQNQERHLLSKITGHGGKIDFRSVRVGLFTDSGGCQDAAGRMARQMTSFAKSRDLPLVLHTCQASDRATSSLQRNFQPLIAKQMKIFGAEIAIPPVLEILEWADRRQFDAIVVNTCGPMALCGWLVSQMLRIPMLAVYHRDLPAQVFGETGGDYRTTGAARGYAKWFYGRAAKIIAPSRAAREAVRNLQTTFAAKTTLVPLAIADSAPSSAGPSWPGLGVRELVRIVCPGAIASKADIDLLGDAFDRVCRRRTDVALVIAGEGRWVSQLRERTGLPIYVLPSEEITAKELCSGADLLVWPSRDDLAGQSVLDAQAAGVPAIVSAAGAAAEFVDDDLTGLVLDSTDSATWSGAILDLLGDQARRQRMSRTARQRIGRFSGESAMESIWSACAQAAAATAAGNSAERGAAAPTVGGVLNT
jgi:glycosyltransferase involved in cell wall biosynthesis